MTIDEVSGLWRKMLTDSGENAFTGFLDCLQFNGCGERYSSYLASWTWNTELNGSETWSHSVLR